MKSSTIIFIASIFAAILIILSPFVFKEYSTIVSSFASAISIVISALANLKAEKNAEELDKALNVERGKNGKVNSVTIDSGTF